MDWSVKAPHNLGANPPDDEVVRVFMSKLDDADGYPPGIGYAHFADLEHSGTLSLLASECDGRACHLSLVDKTAGGFRRYSFDTARDIDSPEIKDLAGNGNLELILPADLSGYEGAVYCTAQWPVIFGWTGNGYRDVSSHYRSYYESQLVSLKKEIAAAEAQEERSEQGAEDQEPKPAASAASAAPVQQLPVNRDATLADARSLPAAPEPPHGPSASFIITAIKPSPEPSPAALPPDTPEPGGRGLNCTKVEAAKIERFLGISRDAGMTDAIKWADSDDPNDREFAAWTFADIATPHAIKYLHTLSQDHQTASTAKLMLEQVNHGPVVYTVEEESIDLDAGTPSP
jgi:hypothetical protein